MQFVPNLEAFHWIIEADKNVAASDFHLRVGQKYYGVRLVKPPEHQT